ncbi:membrane protease YdiL (CAAX protease family) [Novosphingobium chloroacetimidivorans]|uniref:Membrane protease YdiL (CAAX protease family) n=1 Tax=Novosphingobium chloroacetimidivorans TaxID=1428314 RepID=A0A7W7NX20_9SPHN|nr:CPBP family intramembrane glutamic endopeptidase [Novosphingobium chloroacetimidivorans]MBB4858725.1 membrane protease YdiL (CAAX protease family) [Novosphingobium chloroacetimidivorans]
MSIEATQGHPSGRPGWTELAVGIIVLALVGFGVGSQIQRLGLDPMAHGLVLAGWSGLACLAGFGAAWMVWRRPLATFGVLATTRRWLFLGVGAGVLTFVAKGLVVMAFTAVTGIGDSPQGVYADGGSGGWLSLVTATFLIGIFVPLGEELLFRGLVTTVLLRYGARIGVGGGALLFALLHGISIVFPVAVLQGLVAGELYRRSGSLWPGVIVHVICNLPTVPVLVLTSGA